MPSRSIAKVMMVDSNFWSVVLNHVMTNVKKKTVYYITAPPLYVFCVSEQQTVHHRAV